MNRDDMLLLLDYHYWATDRVLAAAQRASDAEFRAASPVSGQTIFDTLVHMMAAERIWRLRCQGESPAALADPAGYPTLADLLEAWQAERAALRAYVEGLSDADLASAIQYRNTKGATFEQTLWQILTHAINHGTQHRSEVAYMLTELGHSPGDLDLMLYLRQQNESGTGGR